ncbi:MAG: YciI family protein [Acidimicrobiia bacterium]|nr:YciI family protein [Acidimicrobiia bacterium]
MQYALLIYDDESAAPAADSAEGQEIFQRYWSFTQDITNEGVNKGGEALHPIAAATTVRVKDGEIQLTDGPFAETKEQLGGFYLVEAESLDHAVSIAARIPAAESGSVEVRPVWDFSEES